MGDISIRKIEEEDIVAAAKIYAEAFNGVEVGENWTVETAVQLIKYFIKMQGDLFYVAVDGQEVIGGIVAIVKPSDNGGLHLTDTDLFVSPRHRKKGIAKGLIKTLLENAIAKYDVRSIRGIANSDVDFPMK